MDKLVNQVAIITGSGRGIGRSIALRFAREGASVMTADLDAKSAEATASEILAFGGQARSKTVDVTVRGLG
jgi:NAD(P)-dependent dehydrogenase (short-subunit alcohol dehydrogenase family)